ncbi:SH3 domain-containing protein [Vibrio sp. S9_S30]|uniref:SH3 domain-containing protein n=1 Tax=Vibrio sp. S9_S30 TaxID=2720226 RepID=UPI00168166AD|nr:SH3 domain-containing protein [Vibrio sp. S9_S30]MBD1556791.1 SH3 domain-containing protein [Vibrio sp. S9_S30]
MKKLLLLVLLGLGGGGAYYYFVMMPQAMVATDRVAKVEEKKNDFDGAMVDLEKKENLATIELGEYYVSSSSLNVRREPDTDALISRVLDIGDKVNVLESNQGWARIAEYNEYGDGEFAQWISEQFLSSTVPENLNEVRSGRTEIAIKGSDNFLIHRELFLSVSQDLINDGVCTNGDFQEVGGWLKSVVYHPRDVYYTYCGGIEREHKLYLDAENGELLNVK